MDFLFHWSVGFIAGSIIVIPFILGRWIYDYDNQTWIQVRWGPVINEKMARHLKLECTELASKELYPITSSRFIIYHSIVANLCGIIAIVPDIGILWGKYSLDHTIWADLFFFHATIDNLPNTVVMEYSSLIFIIALLIWVLVVAIAINAQIDKEYMENFVYLH